MKTTEQLRKRGVSVFIELLQWAWRAGLKSNL
jgi:hypothetical protein